MKHYDVHYTCTLPKLVNCDYAKFTEKNFESIDEALRFVAGINIDQKLHPQYWGSKRIQSYEIVEVNETTVTIGNFEES